MVPVSASTEFISYRPNRKTRAATPFMLSNPGLASKDDSTARLAYRWRGNVTQISECSSGTGQYQRKVYQLQVHQKTRAAIMFAPFKPRLNFKRQFHSELRITMGRGNVTQVCLVHMDLLY